MKRHIFLSKSNNEQFINPNRYMDTPFTIVTDETHTQLNEQNNEILEAINETAEESSIFTEQNTQNNSRQYFIFQNNPSRSGTPTISI